MHHLWIGNYKVSKLGKNEGVSTVKGLYQILLAGNLERLAKIRQVHVSSSCRVN